MSDELISVMEIAKTHGKHRQSIHKLLRRLGIETTKINTEESRGQLATFITKEDYELIRDELTKSKSDNTKTEDANGPGYFYVIQLEPEHDPGRIKVGFATSVNDRLRKHKTAAPFSKVIKRNFRKKFLMLGLIKPTRKMLTGTRQRPARLYQFVSKKPAELKKFF